MRVPGLTKQIDFRLKMEDWAKIHGVDVATLPKTACVRGNCSWCMNPKVEAKKICGNCGNEKPIRYCSRECQVAHWTRGHKKDCVKK